MVDLPVQSFITEAEKLKWEKDVDYGVEAEGKLSEEDVAALGFDMNRLNPDIQDETEPEEAELSMDDITALGFDMGKLNCKAEGDLNELKSNTKGKDGDTQHEEVGPCISAPGPENGIEEPSQMTFSELYFLLVSTGHLLKDYLAAECEDINQEIQELELLIDDLDIAGAGSFADRHNEERQNLKTLLDNARNAKWDRDNLLARCRIDLERLRQPHLIDWNLAKVRRHVRSGNAHGVASEFLLISRVPRYFPLLNYDERTCFQEAWTAKACKQVFCSLTQNLKLCNITAVDPIHSTLTLSSL
ncbi:hypothetical protein TWF694_002756 [Orbilia ellipsospora]|uniref:Uncharacterized protein n=1 Tax=Orbilia ellipsospora TaxID=2528407 RepID=A0AAV9X356_9PEZI